jgi:hypothetical protein
MTHEMKTTALVATTLGVATLAAAAVIATGAWAGEKGDKIQDRLTDGRPTLVSTGAPEEPRFVEVRDVSGRILYRNDPDRGETILAKGFIPTEAGVPMPRTRREALASAAAPAGTPDLPAATSLPAVVRTPLPRPPEAAAMIEPPLPRPTTAPRFAAMPRPKTLGSL